MSNMHPTGYIGLSPRHKANEQMCPILYYLAKHLISQQVIQADTVNPKRGPTVPITNPSYITWRAIRRYVSPRAIVFDDVVDAFLLVRRPSTLSDSEFSSIAHPLAIVIFRASPFSHHCSYRYLSCGSQYVYANSFWEGNMENGGAA